MRSKPSEMQDVMTRKPLSVAADIPLQDAQEIMRVWGMRHLPVTNQSGVVGLLSERDIYRHMAIKPGPATVGEAMTSDPFTVDADERLAVVAQAMADNRLGCVVVVHEGNLLGIFTTTDACRILADLLRTPESGHLHVLKMKEYFAQRAS